MNTRSTATSSGECSQISACNFSKMVRSRPANSSPFTAMHPCATCTQSDPRHSMIPKPVRRDPGSRPRTRTLPAAVAAVAGGAVRALGSNARQDLVRYLDIRIDALYVVQVFQRLQQAHHLLPGLPGNPDRRGSPLSHVRRGGGEAAGD